MIVELDDDDTIPTGNADLRSEIAAAIAPVDVVEWSVATSAGRRGLNEDAWGQRDGVFVVADGMGGRGGGALAARTAIDELVDRVPIRHGADWRSVTSSINAAVIRAGRDQGVEHLGTTLLAAVTGGPVVTLLHVGDSRAYRLSPPMAGAEDGDRIDVLTSDHNVRSELLEAGLELGEYRDRGVVLHGLTSYLGIDDDLLRVDVLAVPVRPGDRLLLCSDGIHRQLSDARILASMSGVATARRAAQQLVDDAEEAGGRDNATALVLHLGRAAGRP